ncbi:MAG TPA: phage holin family protein [Thermomicrobiales bacterium]|nr:phage holin family protein [Thermomicrobiales bacterium]
MSRFLRWALAVALTQTALLMLLAWLLAGFNLSGLRAALVGAVVTSLALAVAWPFIYSLSARFHPLLFPVLTFALTGLVVYLVGQVPIMGLTIDSIWTGILISLVLTIGYVIIGAFFSLSDDRAYDWFVVRPLQRSYATTPKTSVPGVLFLEIDGLAEPILRRALDQGDMPTLQRWLTTGTHRLLGWEPDLSSQTSASQAGILLGDNTNIPAFRWYDKPAGKLMVTSKLATTGEVEHRLSTGQGLLADGGASRWNIFSGDAPDCLCTYSAVGDKKRITSRAYAAYFTSPYTFARTLALFIGDVVRERRQAWAQVHRDERPRIERHFKYALVRASTTTFMQEACVFMLISDMFRGVPAVYATFFAYDEVAHHSGIDRPDAFEVLRTIDAAFARLERVAARAPRPYHFVVLSDHGQSMGATFKQRYGQTLSDLVSDLISPNHQVKAIEVADEDAGYVNVALTEAARQDSRTARLLRRALRGQISDDQIDISGDTKPPQQPGDPYDAANVIVLASGNLGLISFPGWKERMTYEQIVDTYPDLLRGLVRHEGIGFVLVHSESDGGLVIGSKGLFYLEHDYAVGSDPLTPFGPNAKLHLKRADAFGNAPDFLINSLVDPTTGEVAAFEELVGCHGGLGGPQTQPFVLYPAAFAEPETRVVGAAALHAVLKSWLNTVQGRSADTSDQQVKSTHLRAEVMGRRSRPTALDGLETGQRQMGETC